MSSVNYSLNNKGVRLISSEEAFIVGKSGKSYPNPKYHLIGKIDTNMSNMVLSTVRGKKPTYKGDICELNKTAKRQIVNHFYDDNGKRNKKTKAYFVIEKKPKK
ncbi:MAG: hypothetical protein LUI60_02090 [Clostridia bacterium]|nr:hypothetical protein [Clostridia bacterium]